MKKTEKEKLQNEIIDKGIKQGLSANEILKQLKKREVGIQRKRGLEIIRKRKGKRKKAHAEKHTPKKYKKEKRMVVIHNFLTRPFYEDEYEEEEVSEIDITISDIYNRIEEYEFKEHSRYDEILVNLDVVEWDKKDKRRLTFGKLKYIFHVVFEKDNKGNFKFIRLNYVEIIEIVNMIWRLFRREDIEYRTKNFTTIGNIRKILMKKKVI